MRAIKTDRSLISYIVLSLITCGIYGLFFIHELSSDLNTMCAGDGKKTPSLGELILFSFLTCGIYTWFYYYNIGNRLQENAPRYGMHFTENGTTVLMWQLFGSMLCGIGPYVAMNIIIKNTNSMAQAYNNLAFGSSR